LLTDEHPWIQPSFLRHVAEPATLRVTNPDALPPHFSGIEVREAEDGPHRGRLAGTIRAEESDDLTRRNGECQAIEGFDRPVTAT
jgi:hypothetical protein